MKGLKQRFFKVVCGDTEHGLKIKKRLSAANFLAKVLDIISKGKHAISTQVITLCIDNTVTRNLDVPAYIALQNIIHREF